MGNFTDDSLSSLEKFSKKNTVGRSLPMSNNQHIPQNKTKNWSSHSRNRMMAGTIGNRPPSHLGDCLANPKVAAMRCLVALDPAPRTKRLRMRPTRSRIAVPFRRKRQAIQAGPKTAKIKEVGPASGKGQGESFPLLGRFTKCPGPRCNNQSQSDCQDHRSDFFRLWVALRRVVMPKGNKEHPAE